MIARNAMLIFSFRVSRSGLIWMTDFFFHKAVNPIFFLDADFLWSLFFYVFYNALEEDIKIIKLNV